MWACPVLHCMSLPNTLHGIFLNLWVGFSCGLSQFVSPKWPVGLVFSHSCTHFLCTHSRILLLAFVYVCCPMSNIVHASFAKASTFLFLGMSWWLTTSSALAKNQNTDSSTECDLPIGFATTVFSIMSPPKLAFRPSKTLDTPTNSYGA